MQFSYIADIYSHLYASQIVQKSKGMGHPWQGGRLYFIFRQKKDYKLWMIPIRTSMQKESITVYFQQMFTCGNMWDTYEVKTS